jgi:hypothetical protein
MASREDERLWSLVVVMGVVGWVVNWWLGAIPRMNGVFGFLGCKRMDSAPGMDEWKSNLR